MRIPYRFNLVSDGVPEINKTEVFNIRMIKAQAIKEKLVIFCQD